MQVLVQIWWASACQGLKRRMWLRAFKFGSPKTCQRFILEYWSLDLLPGHPVSYDQVLHVLVFDFPLQF